MNNEIKHIVAANKQYFMKINFQIEHFYLNFGFFEFGSYNIKCPRIIID